MYARASARTRSKIIERAGAALAASGLALIAFAIFGVTGASSATSRAGDATIIAPGIGATPLGSGAKATSWTIALPAAAACSGDTSNDRYHAYGFVIPAATDPATMTFDTSGPLTPGLPLFDDGGTQYGPANVATSPKGQITAIPTFNWSKFGATDLPAGNYKVGIACANATFALDKFWDVPVTIKDANLNWTASNPAPGGGGTTTTTTTGGGTTTTTAGGGTTTTTTPSSATTTTLSTDTTTTLAGSSDTTTTSPAVAAASTGTAQPAALAATGSPSGTLTILGVVLFSLGLAIVVLTRRQGPLAAGKDSTS